MERHGVLVTFAIGKSCSFETPTTEAVLDSLMDFTFAEINRRVGRAGFCFWLAGGRLLGAPHGRARFVA